MRRLVLVTVVALGFAGPARAAAPQPDARAFYVMNAATGEVLASHNANESVPIASITKLMTVLVALKHLKPSDIVTVTGYAAQVGESRIPLFKGERISVHDLLAGALIQSANNAADALAAAASNGDIPRFVGWMNARARALGLARHAFRASGRAGCARPRLERARCRPARTGGDALADRARISCDSERTRSRAGSSSCTPGTTCSACSPGSSV